MLKRITPFQNTYLRDRMMVTLHVDFNFTDAPTMEQVNGPPYPNSHCSNFNSSQIQLVLQVSSGAKGVELAVFTAVTLGDDIMSVISLI